MGRHKLLWIPTVLGALGLFVLLTLPDTVDYEFAPPRALSGDADRGEWVNGWYWSGRAAAEFVGRRLGPGAMSSCTGSGAAVGSVIGSSQLYRRFACRVRFAGGGTERATLRVETRNLGTVFCRNCPVDPAQRGNLLTLADGFVELTNDAISHFDANGSAAPAHVAQAERLRDAFAEWAERNRRDDAFRAFAQTGLECSRSLLLVLTAASNLAVTNAYNACADRFGVEHERLAAQFGPRLSS